MYDKLAGMTGTAETEETEFYQIYGLEVSVIPTNRPICRADQADRIYKTRKEKHDAIIDEVERLHALEWPILIGTVNVDVSETLSRQLKRRGLKHEVLNAKYHQREAEIVAGAGQKGAITIATNMAGRGTDIKLDKALDLTQPEAGLQIVGTERHESRRIDRQLRGRSGRQGDPGQSIFFLSLEDDLMRLFGSDRIARWMDKSGAEEGEVITGGLVTRAIEQAQKRVELQNFQSRKRLLEYDDVMNQQREVIYSLRLFALERGEEIKAEARRMIESALERAVTQFMVTAEHPEEWDRGGLRESLMLQYLVTVDALTDADATPSIEKMVERTQAEGEETFRRKIEYLAEFGRTIGIPDVDAQVLSQVMLNVLDERWKDHLYDLDQLRNAIQYRAWGQKDPLVEYKREAFDMFQDLMHDIQSTFTERFFKIQVSAERPEPSRAAPPPPPPPAAAIHPAAPTSGADDLFMGQPPRVRQAPVAPPRGPGPAPAVTSSLGPVSRTTTAVPEVGRNDPCPCGSGKKYKKCHGVGR
jgi:preprotein translocase subunit SecA